MIYKSRNTIVVLDNEGIAVSSRIGILRRKWKEIRVRWDEVVSVGRVHNGKTLTIRRHLNIPPRFLIFDPDLPFVQIDLSSLTEGDASALLQNFRVLLDTHNPNKLYF